MKHIVVVKKACETCQLVIPVLERLSADSTLSIYSQDDPQFPAGLPVTDDSELAYSWRQKIETVPTLIGIDDDGNETGRISGWDRSAWEEICSLDLQLGLPEFRPGCGSATQDPGMPEKLAARYDTDLLKAREVSLANEEDVIEACFDRDWSDGLPVVPPTRERVLRMLTGTSRPADDIVGVIPPDLNECTIEKVAINAVMAGCKPEYLPVVITAVEAALQDEFCMHGLLATTYFSGPLVIVNGPMSRA
ncbi:MAG: thioredoxin, partial [Gammaproteobacteria bacterium]|nr:thioredoxin [Gammaproteobacteria bacterium]